MSAVILSAVEIRQARQVLGASQIDFAALVGVAVETVASWEASRLAPMPCQSGLIRALAASPRRHVVVSILRPAGPVAALTEGLAYILMKGGA